MNRRISPFLVPFLCLMTIGSAHGANPTGSWPQVEITATPSDTRVGDPVTLQVNCKFAEPQVKHTDRSIILTTRLQDIKIEIRRNGKRVAFLPVLPDALRLQDKDGREYSTTLVLFYDHYSKKLIFDSPGQYVVAAMMEKEDKASVTIAVSQAGPESQRLPSELLQPMDFLLLEVGSSEDEKTRAEAVSRLVQLSDRYPNTKIGRWAGARVGMEFYEAYALQLQQKGTPGEKELRSFGLSKEELFDRADRYLQRAKELEDSFPLREESLFLLAMVKSAKGDSQSADALIEELRVKYPLGRFGRIASQRISPDAKK
jgi:hypothetical protein